MKHTQRCTHRVPPPRDQVSPAVARSHLQVVSTVPVAFGCSAWDPRHQAFGKGTSYLIHRVCLAAGKVVVNWCLGGKVVDVRPCNWCLFVLLGALLSGSRKIFFFLQHI